VEYEISREENSIHKKYFCEQNQTKMFISIRFIFKIYILENKDLLNENNKIGKESSRFLYLKSIIFMIFHFTFL